VFTPPKNAEDRQRGERFEPCKKPLLNHTFNHASRPRVVICFQMTKSWASSITDRSEEAVLTQRKMILSLNH